MSAPPALRIAIVGAGPVGLGLGLLAAQVLPRCSVTLFDARPADRDVSADPRTLALSLGSVHLLRRLQAWPQALAAPITAVHVSQAPPSWDGAGTVHITAEDVGEAQLGAVIAYGGLVAAMQREWERVAQARGADTDAATSPSSRAEPLAPLAPLITRFGTPVAALKPVAGGVEVDAGVAEVFDLAVVAEGGVFAEQARKAVTHDYRQTAWVGTATLEGAAPGLAVERFTRHGPVALLPLPALPATSAAHATDPGTGLRRAALVWCVPADDDPVQELTDTQRVAVLNTLLPEAAGRVHALGPLKRFPLGLNAERTLVEGRVVRIGNAAQTLHPVAGQGLNLGLRDAYALVEALRFGADVPAVLRRVEWARAPDRWSMIATTDFLARSFTWRWPGVAAARGAALGALQAATPLRRALARHMMFGRR